MRNAGSTTPRWTSSAPSRKSCGIFEYAAVLRQRIGQQANRTWGICSSRNRAISLACSAVVPSANSKRMHPEEPITAISSPSFRGSIAINSCPFTPSTTLKEHLMRWVSFTDLPLEVGAEAALKDRSKAFLPATILILKRIAGNFLKVLISEDQGSAGPIRAFL